MVSIPVKGKMIPMDLTQAEVKLVLRLRQLRKAETTSLILINSNPLSVCVMGQMEFIEPQIISGSAVL